MTNLTNEEKTREAKSLLREKFPEIFWKLHVADSQHESREALMEDGNRHPSSHPRFSKGQEKILRKIETGTWTGSDEVRYCQRTNYNGDYARNYWITVGGLLTEFGADLKEDLEQAKDLGLELKAAKSRMDGHEHFFGTEKCGCTEFEAALIRFGQQWRIEIEKKLFIAETEIEAARTRLTAARKLAKRLDALERTNTSILGSWAARALRAQSEQPTEDAFELHHMNAEVS